MDFIENEEATGCAGAAELLTPIVYPPVPSHPFPLLKLPRELRDKIYYYALLEPNHRFTRHRRDICDVYETQSSLSPTLYWGTEEATRLFRVCHQVSVESLEIFYSRFTFSFTTLGQPPSFKTLLQHTLTVWARSLIRKIAIVFNMMSYPDLFTLKNEEKWRQTIETIRQSLPNIRHARVAVSIIGRDVPEEEHREKSVVERAMRIIHPLTDVTGLSFEGSKGETAQRERIMRELCEALRSKRERAVKGAPI